MSKARSGRKDSNRSNQLNPEHEAYWKSRGCAGRPNNWRSEAARKQGSGKHENIVNRAVAKPSEQKAALGRYTRDVEQLVRKQLGSNAHIRKAGSTNKHTGIAGSDLDLVVESRPWTASDKSALAQMLQSDFGEGAVRERGKMIALQTGAGDIDIVPLRAQFLPGERNELPTKRFHNNPKGQQVVRGVKLRSEQQGLGWKGDAIERQTIKAQQEFPKKANYELEHIVFSRLSGQL